MALQSEGNVRTETAEEHTSDPLIHGIPKFHLRVIAVFTQTQKALPTLGDWCKVVWWPGMAEMAGELQVPTCRTVWRWQRGRGSGAGDMLAVHAGLYTGPKQRPLHTWRKNSVQAPRTVPQLVYQGGEVGKAWGRKGMLSTGLMAMLRGPASVMGVGRFMGDVMVTGCAMFTGAVTGVGRFTGVVSVNGEVMDRGLVMVTGCPKFIGLEILTALDTFTGLLMLIAAATVTGFVIVPEATEDVILNGVGLSVE
ncbi:hypothetical protein EK904_014796 [Melospiza melodia maxima]|nr:hypothetical protein EK904_014796 [Melospiza melodia maxima]